MKFCVKYRLIFNCWTFLIVCIVITLLVVPGTKTFAQEYPTDWQAPVDISKSGGAIDPHIFTDEHGVVHAIWLDTRSGYYYSDAGANGWTSPVSVKFPFTQPLKGFEDKYHPVYPVIISTPDAHVHALWIDERGRLEYSYVLTGSISNRYAWNDATGIMDSVPGFDAVKDSNGNIYLAFIKGVTPDHNVPGIYYTRRAVNGYWTTPKLLYDSTYFRTIAPDQANIKVAVRIVDGVPQIYIAWDIRAFNRVYFMRSINGGQSWIPATIIDGPDVSGAPVQPKGVRIAANEKDVVAVWQVAQPGQACAQYFQISRDSGASWEPRQKILNGLQDCPEENQLIVTPSGKTVLASQFLKQMYFLAWNGNQWSNIQPQLKLTSFSDPTTLSVVHMSCIQLAPNGEDQILAIGCDTGNSGDIYVTSRNIGPVEGWFSNLANWSLPQSIAGGKDVQLMPRLLSAKNESFHLLWSQIIEPNQHGSLFYSKWDGEQWTTPTSLFPTVDQDVSRPVATISGNHLFATWVDAKTGTLYFSSSDVNLASDPGQWQSPTLINGIQAASQNVDIGVDPNGVISIAYSLPINENRGIYVVHSADSGSTWSQPVMVFDAAKAGWEGTDIPHLLLNPDGSQQILWTKSGSSSNQEDGGLYSSTSTDQGNTWSTPSQLYQGAVQSSGFQLQGTRAIAYWSTQKQDQITLSYRITTDQGKDWSSQIDFVKTKDPGEIYSFLITNRDISIYQVQLTGKQGIKVDQWNWDGTQWIDVGNADLTGSAQNEPTAQSVTYQLQDLLVAQTENGNQILAYLVLPASTSAQNLQQHMYFSIQHDPSKGEQAILSPTVIPTPSSIPTQTISPSQTAVGFAQIGGDSAIPTVLPGIIPVTGLQAQNNWIGLIIGIGIAIGLIILLAILVSWLSDRQKYRRHKSG
jgi:hypothetical protein